MIEKNIKYVKVSNVSVIEDFENILKAEGFRFIDIFGSLPENLPLKELYKLNTFCWVISITDNSFVRSIYNKTYKNKMISIEEFKKIHILPKKFGL